MPKCPQCHNTLTVQHILIGYEDLMELENFLRENVNLCNLIKFLHDIELCYEI